MNLRIFDTPLDACRAAARAIAQRIAGNERSVIGVSGGSTPVPLYEMLSSSPAWEQIAERQVTWVLIDERYVPPGDPQSNSRTIRSTLFRQGIPAAHRFLDFDTTLDDPAATAAHFEQEWRALGLERLDLALLGVGEDGHTASLFPATAVLDETDAVAAAVYVPRLEQWRVTVTLPVILASGLRIVLATGEAKADVLRDVANGADHPVTRAMQGHEAWWFADRAAARFLNAAADGDRAGAENLPRRGSTGRG